MVVQSGPVGEDVGVGGTGNAAAGTSGTLLAVAVVHGAVGRAGTAHQHKTTLNLATSAE